MSQWSPLTAVGTAMVAVGVQGLQIAIRAEFVREVLGARAWIALPGTRDEVPGVVVWGGRAIAVLDVAQFQPGLRRLAPGEIRARTLLVETRAGGLALPADRVSEVFRVHEDNIQGREIRDFELARQEVINGSEVLPLFDPEFLLERLDVRH